MTFIELVKTTGELPNKAITESGTVLELFINSKRHSNGYIAVLWEMINGVQEHIFYYGEGDSIAAAKDDLKRKLLHKTV